MLRLKDRKPESTPLFILKARRPRPIFNMLVTGIIGIVCILAFLILLFTNQAGNGSFFLLAAGFAALYFFRRFTKSVLNPVIAEAHRQGLWLPDIGLLPWEVIDDVEFVEHNPGHLPDPDNAIRLIKLAELWDLHLILTEDGTRLLYEASSVKKIYLDLEKRRLMLSLSAGKNSLNMSFEEFGSEIRKLKEQ